MDARGDRERARPDARAGAPARGAGTLPARRAARPHLGSGGLATNNWPGRARAESLRLWPPFAELVERIDARRDIFDGAIVMGSLVDGRGDALSDIDLLAVAAERRFARAWAARHELSTGALYAWDHVEDEDAQVKGHKWLTPDLVKVECLIATPSSGMRLAEPVAVVVGELDLPNRFTRRGQIPRDEVEAYAAELRETGLVDEVEARYGELKTALRRLRAGPL